GRGQQVEQSPASLNLQEGESTILNCTYTSSINNLQWYRHYVGKSPTVLFIIFSDGDEKQQGRFKTTLNTKKRHSSLSISAPQPGDSATYFCAVE
uniref:Ig-like domain-containing protein n=1 Tax=Sarcophilus harrisii TaxID=9305 RepID=G3VP98_SARHA